MKSISKRDYLANCAARDLIQGNPDFARRNLAGNFSVIFGKGTWHCWQGAHAILLSNEDRKTLYSFPNLDSAIDWLFVDGHKLAARELNDAKKRWTGTEFLARVVPIQDLTNNH